MKKYRNEAMKVVHEQASYYYREGIINAAEMKEFDKGCLVSTADTAGASTVKRSPAAAAASEPHSHSVK
ncbi:hypothetical protein AGMMS49942_25540 [Spirochaetia bacterium]|nr:hypothetical protein AGMMS49942_25540 [Spirochaetia bacterium]